MHRSAVLMWTDNWPPNDQGTSSSHGSVLETFALAFTCVLVLTATTPLLTMKSYLPLGQLSGMHTDSINCTAFSLDGKFLAMGSDDCSLAIWSVDDRSIIAQHHLNSSILTVVWDLHVCKWLYFGCIDGTAAYIDEPQVCLI
jgi:WD40 repeat protein